MYLFKKAIWVLPVLSLGLTACGGEEDAKTADTSVQGGSTGSPSPSPFPGEVNDTETSPSPPSIPLPGPLNLASPTVGALSNDYYPVSFNWSSSTDATGYTLCRKDVTFLNHCEVLGTTTDMLHFKLNLGGPIINHLADFFVLATNSTGSTASNDETLSSDDLNTFITYIKASNPGTYDRFSNVSLSADGKTLAVGASGEDSQAKGINSDQQNDSWGFDSGAVYVFRFDNNKWTQEAYIKGSNSGYKDRFGESLSLSADGNTLVVGARYQDSTSTGINQPETCCTNDSGAAYVFRFKNDEWTEQAFIKPMDLHAYLRFGISVSLSADGDTLAVGAEGESSNGTPNSSGSLSGSGAAYVFRFNGTDWEQHDFIKASNPGKNDNFGNTLSLSGDGKTLAVGAYREDSSSKGIHSEQNQDSNENQDYGAVYVFRFDDTEWSQEAYVKASDSGYLHHFGDTLSLSNDGNTLVVGTKKNETAYVFRFTENAWTEEIKIKASNTESGDLFGYSVSVSGDGNILAVGAYEEESDAKGMNGDESKDNSGTAGAAYIFRFADSAWEQLHYIKATNTQYADYFGASVSLSNDGKVLAVGSTGEDSKATGVNGEQNSADQTGFDSGAVYIY
ncbi:hypothetical protein [Grimontia sp. NTOU-MAR1]|uniref:hypothetical protein n=1 Tax=Grimontia sp. NTOU-MAR1 TaxID=3111011 RepID=UPI002DB6F06E|nr:hypothetical protein [Grimontia sp. NTOU-MAR1]WRV98637.1 hypothetical protein VP504_04140 [Grimontia sp. NTOU-MAR1]